MSVSSLNKRTYDSLYKYEFDNRSFEVLSKTLIFNLVTKNLCFNNKRVLEIGFGSGNLISNLLKRGAIYYGLEISKSAINLVRKNYGKGVNLKLIKNNKIPFKNCYFDFVILSHSLEHIASEDKILSECKRVLAKGGAMIVGVPSINCDNNLLHYRTYDLMDFNRLSKKFNLSINRIYAFKKIKFFDKLMSTKKVNLIKKSNGNSLIKKLYYLLISPLLSYAYTLNLGGGLVNEYWVVFKNE